MKRNTCDSLSRSKSIQNIQNRNPVLPSLPAHHDLIFLLWTL
uniref:Uncharacterized protein n=1 Tax=Microcebus murinus TaxID=30608 RepID=A0A8C5Y9N3_MICMU